MMDRIEPSDWDVIVIGSGLPECLIASALSASKEGKSVLLIDEDDTYGSEFASFTLASMEGCAAGKRTGAVGPMDSDQPEGCALSHSACANGFKVVALPELSIPACDVEIYRLPGADLGGERAFILDLLPKVCYQAESLVDILVRTKAHNYMEFKQVEGSYIYTVGKGKKSTATKLAASTATSPSASSASRSSATPTLSPSASAACPGGCIQVVPASKSDVFQDRNLSLLEKRQLMTFIQATLEALEGQGRLKDLISSGMPLDELMSSEGLPEGLRNVIMYGIAMIDQEQQHTGITGRLACSESEAVKTKPTTAAQGAASLRLLMNSIGRFGAPGAFMVPGFGCGSISEAFVRFCAVHGATTVLRQRVGHILLGDRPLPVPGGAAADTRGGGEEGREGCDSGAGEPARDAAPSCSSQEQADAPSQVNNGVRISQSKQHLHSSSVGEVKKEPKMQEDRREMTNQSASASQQHEVYDEVRVVGIITASGQQLRCKSLVASCKILSTMTGSRTGIQPPRGSEERTMSDLKAGGGVQPTLSRVLAILDGSLVTGKDNLMLVFPPLCPALGGCNKHPVRGLQLGPTAHVSPTGRYLLYLSTVGDHPEDAADLVSSELHSPPASRLALQAALLALVRADRLVSDAGKVHPSEGAMSAVSEPHPLSESKGVDNSAADTNEGKDEPSSRKSDSGVQPRALQVHYYRQMLNVVSDSWGLESLPSNVICCGMPGGDSSVFGLVGYEAIIKQTEQTFRKHFPDEMWLTELKLETEVLGDEAEEDVAVNDLESIVSKLKDSREVARRNMGGGEEQKEDEGGCKIGQVEGTSGAASDTPSQ